jgi:hypothetical protein
MKRITFLIAITFFTFSMVSAQTDKKKFPSKPAEQNEINANKRLEREIQQRQLLAKPERLVDRSESEAERRKNQIATANKKTKHGKQNCLAKKKS